jgi:hypothetical protein
MKISKFILLVFGVLVLGISWKVYSYFNPNFEKCFVENNEDFKSNIRELNSIVNEIIKLSLKESYNISTNKLPEHLKSRLEKLGIKSFSLIKNTNNNCKEKNIIELNISKNWNIEILNNVKLIYFPCNEETKLNYHSYNGNHIDTWGQGQNWLIFSDTDFI